MKKTTQIVILVNTMGGNRAKKPAQKVQGARRPMRLPPMPPLRTTQPGEGGNKQRLEHAPLAADFSLRSAELAPDVISPEMAGPFTNSMEVSFVYSDPDVEQMRHRLHREYIMHEKLKCLLRRKGLPRPIHVNTPHRSNSFLKDVLSELEIKEFLNMDESDEEPERSGSSGSDSVVTTIAADFCVRTGANVFEDNPSGLEVQVITPDFKRVDVVKNLAGRTIEQIDVEIVDVVPGPSKDTLPEKESSGDQSSGTKEVDGTDLDSSSTSFKSIISEKERREVPEVGYPPEIINLISANLDSIDDISVSAYRDFKDFYADLSRQNAVNVTVSSHGRGIYLDFFIPDFIQNGLINNPGLEAMIIGTLIQERFANHLSQPTDCTMSGDSLYNPMDAPDPPIRPENVTKKITVDELATAIKDIHIPEKPMTIHKPKSQTIKERAVEQPGRLPTLPPPKVKDVPKPPETKSKEYKWIGYTRAQAKVCGRTVSERPFKMGLQSSAEAATLVRLSNQSPAMRRAIQLNRVYVVEEV